MARLLIEPGGFAVNSSNDVVTSHLIFYKRACQGLQGRTLFLKKAVPVVGLGYLLAGHVQAIPGL